MTNDVSEHSVEDLAKALKDAREHGQQVVPIVGAGLSADSGFPVITAVVRYLGKLCTYIRMHGPLCDYREQKNPAANIIHDHFRQYEVQPWRFVENFGWPDWFQLNEDLFRKLQVKNGRKSVRFSGFIEGAVREELDRVLSYLNPHGTEEYSSLRRDITNALTDFGKVKLFKGPKRQNEIEELLDKINLRFDTNWTRSAIFDVIGDWRQLILYFTNYGNDYADALFARFGATRKPGQGHRFLAFLSKVLAVRTILTFNFDSLIEEAMETEGIRCKVFAMERGAGLPYQNLLRDQLSVIKAHGSTHALLLDEQLDRPLSKEYLERFREITGSDPLLLVVGCSAGDRRLRDLVLTVLERAKRVESADRERPSVAWLHYEPAPPDFLKENGVLRQGTLSLRTNNPGATLLHLYSWLTNSNPASRVPYPAHVQQPIELASLPPPDSKNGSTRARKGQFDWIAVEGSRWLTASQILLKRANEWARAGYQFIWIDLESLHTFAGVIGSIIDQCRKYDPDIAPSLLPADIDQVGEDISKDRASLEEVIDSAVKRVLRALRRARYYLAIDGLGTYAWPATTHHGVTHLALSRGAERRIETVAKFLIRLENADLGESRVGVGLDKQTVRYDGLKLPRSRLFESLFEKARRQGNTFESNRRFRFTDHFRPLRKDLPIFTLKKIPADLEIIPPLRSESANDKLRRYSAFIAMMMFSLSCFRRTRPLVATSHLLQPLLGEAFDRDRLQQILSLFAERSEANDRIWILQQLEGGSYWFNHSIRDQIYAKNTQYTDSDSIRECLSKPFEANREHRRKAVFQLFLGAITHHRISQIWYNRTFVQSRDTFAFLEYTYHRISSIRNLVKLRAFARVGAGNRIIAEDLVSGISKCSELIRLLNKNNPPFKQLRFGEDGPFGSALRQAPEEDSPRRNWRAEVKEIEKYLQRRHHRQLHGLYRGWTRAELILRTQVPAEQLLHWCDELLSDDLIHRCNRLVIGYNKSKQPRYYNFGTKTKPDELIDPELENEKGDLKEFRRFLQDLQVQLWIERSDYATCMRQRRKHLWHSLGDRKRTKLREADSNLRHVPDNRPLKTEIECSKRLIDECGIRQCHQLLNIANCKLKFQQELTCDEKGLEKKTKEVLLLLEEIKHRLRQLAPKTPWARSSARTNDHNEAWLRLLHLEAEARIRHVSMFSHDGFTGDPEHWKQLASYAAEARIPINQGLEEVGGRDVHTRAVPRSVILHPTADAALYLQYRSVFYLFKGRTDWITDPEDKANGWKEALRSFEMARGGLYNDTPLISALIEIYVAEAVLARGRAVLFDTASEHKFRQAQQAYDHAHGALRRARECLLGSHHHLMWRKLFFRISTQYHSDRLLWRYAQVQQKAFEQKAALEFNGSGMETVSDDYWQENAREALLRLRRSYQTLVSALDLYLPLFSNNDEAHTSKRQSAAHSQRFRWLYRMWWELTLCGYATGRIAMESIRQTSISPDQAHEYVIQQLEWLNKADGVDESTLGPVFANSRECLRREYEQSLLDNDGTTPLMKALILRRNLIYRANNLGKNRIQNGSRT